MSERIKALNIESEQRLKQVNDLEERLVAAHNTIEERNLQLREIETRSSQVELQQQSEQSLIQSLQTEKKHLEEALSENMKLKEQYRDKVTVLTARMEEVFKDSENSKRQLIGIDELRKDRDARIGALRKEIDELTVKFETTENLNAALEV